MAMREPAPFETVVPVIDIAALFGADAAAKSAVARRIAAACREVGFFCITGHGASTEASARVFDEAKRFFALPEGIRSTVRLNRLHRGYIPQGITTQLRMDAQRVDGSGRVGRVTRPNQSHSFIIGPELGPEDSEVMAGTRLHGPNQWPVAVPGLRPAMLAYQADLYRVGAAMLHGFALSLGLAEDALDSYYEKPLTHLRVLDYPPLPADADAFGAAPHTDIGAITILTQDGTPGLEVQLPDGTWIAAPAPAGALGVNCGDMMERWSNGQFHAARHRVVNPTDTHRYSMVFLYDPSYRTVVEPLPALTRERPPGYEPVVYGDHLARRMEATYDYDAL